MIFILKYYTHNQTLLLLLLYMYKFNIWNIIYHTIFCITYEQTHIYLIRNNINVMNNYL